MRRDLVEKDNVGCQAREQNSGTSARALNSRRVRAGASTKGVDYRGDWTHAGSRRRRRRRKKRRKMPVCSDACRSPFEVQLK
jgi:hypothetical protein